MVSEYVPGQWLFIRYGILDCYGKFVCAKDLQIVVDVHIAEAMPTAFLPKRVPDYHLVPSMSSLYEPSLRIDFGRAACLIYPIEPPLVWKREGMVQELCRRTVGHGTICSLPKGHNPPCNPGY